MKHRPRGPWKRNPPVTNVRRLEELNKRKVGSKRRNNKR